MEVWRDPTYSQMGVNTGVSGRSSQCLVLAVRDVLVSAGIAVFLCQTKVNDVDQVSLLPQSHQEVVRLHVAVDEILGVNVLQSTYLRRSRNNTAIKRSGVVYMYATHSYKRAAKVVGSVD